MGNLKNVNNNYPRYNVTHELYNSKLIGEMCKRIILNLSLLSVDDLIKAGLFCPQQPPRQPPSFAAICGLLPSSFLRACPLVQLGLCNNPVQFHLHCAISPALP